MRVGCSWNAASCCGKKKSNGSLSAMPTKRVTGPRISEAPPTQRPGNHQSSGAMSAGRERSTPGERASELSRVVTSVPCGGDEWSCGAGDCTSRRRDRCQASIPLRPPPTVAVPDPEPTSVIPRGETSTAMRHRPVLVAGGRSMTAACRRYRPDKCGSDARDKHARHDACACQMRTTGRGG